jgi:dihydroorotase
VRDGVLDERRLVELMAVNPARILDVPGGSIGVGNVADITVIDPVRGFVYTEDSVVSKSANSPFLEQQLTGKAVLTICNGRLTHSDL